jgi:hypothetical protein
MSANSATRLAYEVFVSDGPVRAGDQRMPNGDRLVWNPLASTLIFGEHDALLVDPPFTHAQVRQVGDWVERSGRRLAYIYATHGHGDHWFGTGELARRFPDVTAYATEGTIKVMRRQATEGREQLSPRHAQTICPARSAGGRRSNSHASTSSPDTLAHDLDRGEFVRVRYETAVSVIEEPPDPRTPALMRYQGPEQRERHRQWHRPAQHGKPAPHRDEHYSSRRRSRLYRRELHHHDRDHRRLLNRHGHPQAGNSRRHPADRLQHPPGARRTHTARGTAR